MCSSLILTRLWRDDRGATAIEYGLIVALIVIAMITALGSMGDGTGGLWGDVKDQVVAAMGN